MLSYYENWGTTTTTKEELYFLFYFCRRRKRVFVKIVEHGRIVLLGEHLFVDGNKVFFFKHFFFFTFFFYLFLFNGPSCSQFFKSTLMGMGAIFQIVFRYMIAYQYNFKLILFYSKKLRGCCIVDWIQRRVQFLHQTQGINGKLYFAHGIFFFSFYWQLLLLLLSDFRQINSINKIFAFK